MPLKLAIRWLHKTSPFITLGYRISLPVNEVLVFESGTSFPICPRCRCTVDREYMRFCACCGQRLGWTYFELAKTVYAPRGGDLARKEKFQKHHIFTT